MGKCTLTLVTKADESYIFDVEATLEVEEVAEDIREEKREKS